MRGARREARGTRGAGHERAAARPGRERRGAQPISWSRARQRQARRNTAGRRACWRGARRVSCRSGRAEQTAKSVRHTHILRGVTAPGGHLAPTIRCKGAGKTCNRVNQNPSGETRSRKKTWPGTTPSTLRDRRVQDRRDGSARRRTHRGPRFKPFKEKCRALLGTDRGVNRSAEPGTEEYITRYYKVIHVI